MRNRAASDSFIQRIMPNASQDTDVWKFQRPVAELQCGSFVARVDASQPQLGVHGLCLHAQSIAGSLFSLTPSDVAAWPAALADAYVRGGDLVATYEPAKDWPYAPTNYWRAEQAAAGHGALATLSLLVSIQTNLLDTHPRVRVATELPAEEVIRLSVGASGKLSASAVDSKQCTVASESATTGVLWRLPGGQLSYVEIAETNDFRLLVIQRDDRGVWRADWELFAEFLEKGVIRRARLQAAFLPRENDVELAAELCRGLESRPLPLTT
jgi:hypothetical protein